ncbi:AbrB family transcriptional regulator (stage V sporulation protein T) [Caldicoprobacter guelmensis]|uniref:stage V sporulation protein T n=1 Tax=Caldicoprobacter guelmensis TaxID=1170224 RepID=UPI00311CDEB4|nr:AbrB family transcriptional regulator (stage V sporulation protein T) [Caldicoprobacter guelmensis]
MKATGIVRRIDELGRVVIPKEIRRTLRIREGDPLEIYTDEEGEVILKKYSPIEDLSDLADEYVESLHKILGHITCVSDKDFIVAVAGIPQARFKKEKISEDLERIINEKKMVLANRANKDAIYPVLEKEGGQIDYTAQVIVPIISGGESIGAVILLSKEPNITMGDTEMKIAQAAAAFIGKQMEQ